MIKTANRINSVEEYYFSKKLAEVRALGTSEEMVINLGIGSPDLPPSPDVIEALEVSAKNPYNHGYQNYKGIPALRKAISDFSKRIYEISLDPETMVLPLMGSKEGIMHVSMAFLDQGDEVLVPDPGYLTYASASKLLGAIVKTYSVVPDNNFCIDIESLRTQDLSRVKIFWLNTPHMPTGAVMEPENLRQLIALARENNFLIVNDNPYSLILNDKPLSLLSLEGAEDISLELNSLSKSHNMAGWRVGWVSGKKEYVDAVLKVKSNMDSGMFLGLQEAAVKALSLEENWFNELNHIYAKRREIAVKIADLLGCHYGINQSGLFLWASIPESIRNVEDWIDEILYGVKVFITPGSIFGSNGKRFIRISLCNSEKTMREAYQRLATRYVKLKHENIQ